jgi:cell division control protein 6
MKSITFFLQNLVVFLVLDEIDYLLPEERTDFLYALSRLEESPIVREEYGFLDNKVESRLNLLTITRDKNFRYYLDSSTASSLGQNFITFNPYTRYQLFDILSVRAELGLQEGSYSDEILDTISGLAEEGDARFAIELLWRTAKVADQEGKNKLTDEHVRKAIIAVMPIEKS